MDRYEARDVAAKWSGIDYEESEIKCGDTVQITRRDDVAYNSKDIVVGMNPLKKEGEKVIFEYATYYGEHLWWKEDLKVIEKNNSRKLR